MDSSGQDKISVIVPVYNGQDYLIPCIESILMQNDRSISKHENTYDNGNVYNNPLHSDIKSDTLFQMEILIINDGSTDNTADVCRHLADHYKNIRIITLEDLGVSCARNAGLSEATGNYITFVDADDRLLPGTLACLWELAVRTDSDITGCGFEMWHNEEDFNRIAASTAERKIAKNQPQENIDGYHHEEISYTGIQFIDTGILNGDTRCWGKLYRRKSIEGLRFEEGITIGEDMLFLLAATQCANKITITSFKGYGYYQNPFGAMNRVFKDSYMDQITCWQMAAERIAKVRPDLKYKATGIILISIMLTVGKIAELPKNHRKKHQDKLIHCHQQVTEAIKVSGAFSTLDNNYRLKIKLFKRFPALYIIVYKLWKQKKRN